MNLIISIRFTIHLPYKQLSIIRPDYWRNDIKSFLALDKTLTFEIDMVKSAKIQ